MSCIWIMTEGIELVVYDESGGHDVVAVSCELTLYTSDVRW